MKALFDLQRTTFEQSQQAIEQGLETQQQFAESAIRTGVAAQRSMQRQGMEVTRQWAVASTGAMWAGADGDRREEVDEQFDALVDAQEETWDAFEESLEEGLAAYEELTERQKEFLEQSMASFTDTSERMEGTVIEIAEDAETATEQGTEAMEESVEALTEEFEEISNLNQAHAERLNEAGIDGMEALADAQTDAVARAAEVSELQAQAWIDAAER